MPQNGGNGHSREYNLAIIETLIFPDIMSEDEVERFKHNLHAYPESLNYVVDVAELYEYLMATPEVLRETKEQFVAGLKHYLGEEGTAYAVMTGLYAYETALALPDLIGARILFQRVIYAHPMDLTHF